MSHQNGVVYKIKKFFNSLKNNGLISTTKKIKHEVITYPKNIITGIFFHIISYNGLLKMKNLVEKYKYEDTEIIDLAP